MTNSTNALQPPANIIIVGCGGVASYLLPCLLKVLPKGTNVILVDKDELELKNMDRQLFKLDMIGMNKAEALAKVVETKLPLEVVPEFFTPGSIQVPEGSLLLGCADNHAARKAILQAADDCSGHAIIGGNEFTDADAYYYHFTWRDSPQDPRIYFPEINTDKTGDPTRPRGCQGEAQVQTPQLAIANFGAAHHMLWLFWFYFAEVHKMEADTKPYWPVRHWNSFVKQSTERFEDKKAREAA